MSYDLVTGDTGSTLAVTITNSSTLAPVNLTGSTVRFRWMDGTGLVEVIATVSDPVNGVAEWTFTTGQITGPVMRIEIEVTDATGKITSGLQPVVLKVRPQIA